MNLIAAVDKNWAIGKNNELLVRIPMDQKFFRETTTGKVVVMGRKTLESFPNGLPLKNRTNIVLTHNPNYKVNDAIIVHSLDELHEELKKYNSEDVYVIGGEKIYEQLLDNPEEEVRGTVKELAEKYGQDVMTMVGFLDGINDSLKVPNPIETMDENTDVTLVFDKEMLYKNMVDAKADWLYELPQWDKIFDADTKKKLYREQKQSGTVRKAKKIGRNEPCPCGSGKKYKYCCGKNA